MFQDSTCKLSLNLAIFSEILLHLTDVPYSRDPFFTLSRGETSDFLPSLGRSSHLATWSWGRNLSNCFLIRLLSSRLALALLSPNSQGNLLQPAPEPSLETPRGKIDWFLAFPTAGFESIFLSTAKAVITCPCTFQLLKFYCCCLLFHVICSWVYIF